MTRLNARTVRALAACAGVAASLTTASGQLIKPGGTWFEPAGGDVTFMQPAGPPASNVTRFGNSRLHGGALIALGTGSATENLDATRDRIQTTFGQYTHRFNLSAAGGGMADIVVPILADANLTWAGPANNRARFKIQVDVQLFRERAGPLVGFDPVGGVTTLDTGWFNDPGGARTATISQTWMQRYANQPTGPRRYEIKTTVRSIAQADSGGVLGAAGSGISYNFRSTDHTISRGVTTTVAAEPANYAGANSRTEVAAAWARNRFNVTGQGVNVGIIEPGKATNHASFGGRLTRANNGAAGTDNYDSEHTTSVASIIGSASGNAAQAGVAPGASMITADVQEWVSTTAAIDEMINNRFGAGNAGVINFSMSGGIANGEGLDAKIDDHNNVTFVWASGNQRVGPDPVFTYVGSVPNPAYAFNNIAVGALDSTFEKMENFSSDTAGMYPTKPDVVAPGGYVLSASNRDLDNDGSLDDFTRSFVGNNWSAVLNPTHTRNPIAGRVSGTSFAAPHVTGVIALAHEYANDRPADYDARAKDQRVMKAALIAGARTTGIRNHSNMAWTQAKAGGLRPADPLKVTRSLDKELGGGAADAMGMLSIYSEDEARKADNNTAQNFKIDLRPTMLERNGFWDLENVEAKSGATPGTVDYLLGSSGLILDDFNNPQGIASPISYLRVALTWNREVNAGAYKDLANLELGLFIDGFNDMNITGWDGDPGEGDAVDFKFAFTENAAENVKLFDFEIPSLWFFGLDLAPNGDVDLRTVPNFYLQVRNNSMDDVEYGIAASFVRVPTPSGAMVLVALGVLASRRRR